MYTHKPIYIYIYLVFYFDIVLKSLKCIQNKSLSKLFFCDMHCLYYTYMDYLS